MGDVAVHCAFPLPARITGSLLAFCGPRICFCMSYFLTGTKIVGFCKQNVFGKSSGMYTHASGQRIRIGPRSQARRLENNRRAVEGKPRALNRDNSAVCSQAFSHEAVGCCDWDLGLGMFRGEKRPSHRTHQSKDRKSLLKNLPGNDKRENWFRSPN